MSLSLLQQRLKSYGCRTANEEEQALREMTQEVILAALGRAEFFSQVAFHGGTCLRIFHGLNRFSEDLDFALRQAESEFELRPFLDQVTQELKAYGYLLEIQDRAETTGAVCKAFLKDDSIGRLLELRHLRADRAMRKIRIKLEIDTRPPAGATYRSAFLTFPFLSSVTVHDPESLFAGKIHALLCREYLKGRDWYDFLWYAARKDGVNHPLLTAALKQTGPWAGSELRTDSGWLYTELTRRIAAIDWSDATQDVQRFLKPEELPTLKLWSRELFQAQVERLFGPGQR